MDIFVSWCEQNHLQLTVAKTKELVGDLRKTKAPVTPVSIQGVSVDIAEDYVNNVCNVTYVMSHDLRDIVEVHEACFRSNN